MSIKDKIKSELTAPSIPLIAFGIALDLTVGQLTVALKIPLYLDSIGTILVAVLVGPYAGTIAGSFANIMAAAFGNPTMMFFIPVVAVIGAFTGFVANKGWFRRWWLCVIGGLVQGILAATVSAPISSFLFGGTMMAGTDALVYFFRSMGNNILTSVWYQGLTSDPVDKTVSYLLVFFILQNLPLRLISRFRGASNVLQPSSRDDVADGSR
ncbi:MAG TPA: ECF transporter S component [Bacteroidota bacterium]|nr:ECF transporter S component [Bacteroidota bacterium]